MNLRSNVAKLHQSSGAIPGYLGSRAWRRSPWARGRRWRSCREGCSSGSRSVRGSRRELPPETRLPLLEERVDALDRLRVEQVVCHHRTRVGVRFGERPAELPVEEGLAHAHRFTRLAAEVARERGDRGVEGIRRHDAIHETERSGTLGIDELAGE